MQKILCLLAFLCCNIVAEAQQKFTISGYITDSESSEQLIAANILAIKTLQGTNSNTYGFYSLTLPKGKVQIKFSYVGYGEQVLELDLTKDVKLDVKLKASVALQEVEIVATKAQRIEQRSQMSQIDVPIQQIKKIPALLGEVDVLKALQLLPGVQGGTEGQSGLYVRGGGPDQNLIMLDGVPVYNVSHLLGFFSVFNADALKNVTLYKGGFPARYGGRLSSVIDIQMKEGNAQKFHGEGSIGLISSRLTLEGPIVKDRTAFLFSARRTYIDAIMKPIIAYQNAKSTTNNNTNIGVGLYFYDINAKINHKINDNHRVYLSAYTGRDLFNLTTSPKQTTGQFSNTGKAGTNWGNLTAAARWNWQVSNKLFTNTTLTYSRYGFEVGNEQTQKRDTVTTTNSTNYTSGIKDYAVKFDIDYVPNPHHYIKMGINATDHTYNPGATQFQFDPGIGPGINTVLGSAPIKAQEYSTYIEDDLHFGAFKANIGLHASGFVVNGTFYKSLQPRVGLNYLLNNDVAIKASFCTMRQYINLLSNEGLGLPSDLWVPSTDRVKPQDSWQAAIGVARTVKEEYEVSIEGYYKQMKNVLSYSTGQNFLGINRDWQDKVVQGNGEAYGMEFLVQKKKGRLSGWVGYTLSWNYRTFAELNGGNPFPYRYDRRHDLEIVASYELSPKWSFNATWVYSTGTAFSLANVKYARLLTDPRRNNRGPDGGQPIDPSALFVDEIAQPSEKNAYRYRAYHRMDIGFERKKKHKRYESAWVFGAYNVYSRKNPFFLYSTYDETLKKDVYNQVSLFPIIPNIAWTFKF
jgi:TonB-dependent Receptor Plug Domain/CarboxypepD_reg-like domain